VEGKSPRASPPLFLRPTSHASRSCSMATEYDDVLTNQPVVIDNV
jgi:hypothetical protein